MRVIRRHIKHPRIELRTGMVTLILPHDLNAKAFATKHKRWILEKQAFIRRALNGSRGRRLSIRPISSFKKMVEGAIERLCAEMNMPTTSHSFRSMRSKWASCSRRSHLTLNTTMSYLPGRMIEYILYHELNHTYERKHNIAYWQRVSTRFPDYRKCEQDLFAYWFLIQTRKRKDEKA